MSDWRKKFKFSKNSTDVGRDTRILNFYLMGMETEVCTDHWNKAYNCNLTTDEFVAMAKSLGYSRGK